MKAKLRLVVMEGLFADYPAKFRAAVDQLGIAAEIDTFPHVYTRELTRRRVADIRAMLGPQNSDELVFFFPGALEVYFDEPDMSFHCSAYRSWFDPRRMMVIPHPWTPVRSTPERDALEWRSKPDLTIGFMGSTYRGSRGARLAGALPEVLKRRIEQGWLRRDARRVGWFYEHHVPIHYLPAFPRIETLDSIEQAARSAAEKAKVEIIETAGFDGTDTRRLDFARHLQHTTYALCPRGCENFSFRLYEALRFGRVPVIIDTDMVLPACVDWQRVAVIVPGTAVGETYERIVADYEGHDEASFLERQAGIFAASDVIDGETWLPEALRTAMEQLAGPDCSAAQSAAKARA
jgi:hypothetical protein